MNATKVIVFAVYCLVSRELVEGHHVAGCKDTTAYKCEKAKARLWNDPVLKDKKMQCVPKEELPDNTVVDNI